MPRTFRALVFLTLSFLTYSISGEYLSAQPISDPEGDIGIGTVEPHSSALLDLTSTTKGLLIPRLTTTERDVIQQPATGLLIYNRTDSTIQINCGSEFRPHWCPIVLEQPGGGLSARLSPGALWYGSNDTLAVELLIGIPDAVLVSTGTLPTWTRDLQLNSVEVDSLTVNDYANITNNIFT
ncbi:MAG: hypothetical protein AB7H80_18425, partial [Candidatus Kapaibacterium sp.]